MLSTLRKDKTAAAALTRPVVIRHAKEGRRSGLRVAVAATYPCQAQWQVTNIFGGHSFGSKPGLCRMPSAPLMLDPSQQQEGGP